MLFSVIIFFDAYLGLHFRMVLVIAAVTMHAITSLVLFNL